MMHPGGKHLLHAFWNRRQTTKFNGVSYPVQKAAEAVYSAEGRPGKGLDRLLYGQRLPYQRPHAVLGYACTGGENSPYIWVKTDMDSWEFFDMLLNKAGVVCTPGAGFGRCGQGYIRISAFNSHENVKQGDGKAGWSFIKEKTEFGSQGSDNISIVSCSYDTFKIMAHSHTFWGSKNNTDHMPICVP